MTGGDELERMARANPWPAAAGDERSPAARALAEDIMTTPQSRPVRRNRTPLAVAAALAGALALGGVVLALDDGGGGSARRAEPRANTPDTSGAVEPDTGLTSCVETYDLATLANREYAFAGTVTSVEGDQATFAVDEWYRGDGSAEVTLGGAAGLGGVTSAGEPVDLAPGTRLLVAGDGGFAWSCGFTQPYDEAVARQWADTLTR